jgi:hypothetical protein
MTTHSSLTTAAPTSGQPPSRPGRFYPARPPSNLRGAKKNLMETHPNSKFEPTNWDHSHLKLLIATALPFFTIDKPDSNRQLETIRNRSNPFTIMQMTFSNRPKKTGAIFAGPAESAAILRLSNFQLLTSNLCISLAASSVEANRSYRRLEFNISPTKQRTEVLSNRPKSADSARIGVLRDQRESKELSSVFWRQKKRYTRNDRRGARDEERT